MTISLETQTGSAVPYHYGHMDDNDLTLLSGLFIKLKIHSCDKRFSFNLLKESCLRRNVKRNYMIGGKVKLTRF